MFIHTNKIIITADIGGTHITTALIAQETLEIEAGSIRRHKIDGKSLAADELLHHFLRAMENALSQLGKRNLAGISIAMPGPFDYSNGIFKLRELDKFNLLYGISFKELLYSQLPIARTTPILFKNDADCFGLGGYQSKQAVGSRKVISITLGTGLGASFVEDGIIVDKGTSVPPEGNLFNQPLDLGITPDLKYAMAEDIISSRGILNYVNARGDLSYQDVAVVARQAIEANDPICLEAFKFLGYALGKCLAPWCLLFEADTLVIGGGIAGAANLFMPTVMETLAAVCGCKLNVDVSPETETITMIGAAYALGQQITNEPKYPEHKEWRKTHQQLLPRHMQESGTTAASDAYQIYPYTSLEKGCIHSDFDSLAGWMADKKGVAIDGYIGNDWTLLQKHMSAALQRRGIRPVWIDMTAFMKSEKEIESIVAPFLGSDTSVWGTKAKLVLSDYFLMDLFPELLSTQRLSSMASELVIVFGIGAGLASSELPIIYIDLPRNEIQYRMRAGAALNLGATKSADDAMMYKRSYFVDWPVLNQHRSAIENRIAIVVDGQWREQINWITYSALSAGFEKMAMEPIRARPWFAPGAWGGHWMKKHIPELSPKELNYAWSFELIVPENGLVLESSGYLLEVPFDWLMTYNPRKILGDDADTFGHYFPIRFDFLDTFGGGNLSIQCHPSRPYIQQHFGEKLTQDETYYILDCAPGAGVYLGFQADIEPTSFRDALENSQRENKPIAIEKYVQLLPSHKHDLFLIPNQTIHSAAADNLVLEISATPYIFTFKMYDWVRPDLNGRPRPINIDHAFQNLDFTRKGSKVIEELCSKPQVLEAGPGFKRIHLPTHPAHFYDIHRLEFTHRIEEVTAGKCLILMVVEGRGVQVQLDNGKVYSFAYAETFIIPAAVKQFSIINITDSEVKVIKAFVR